MGDSHIVAPNGQGVLKCELKLLQMILTECNLNHTLADQADRNKSDVYIINTVPYNMHQANVDVFEGFLKDVHRFGGPYIYADDVDFQRDTQEIFDLLDPECQRRMFQFIIPLSFPFCDDSDRKDEDGKIVKNVSLTFPHFPEKGKFHWFFPFRVGPNDPEKLVLLEWAKPGFLKDHPVMLKMALEGDRVRSSKWHVGTYITSFLLFELLPFFLTPLLHLFSQSTVGSVSSTTFKAWSRGMGLLLGDRNKMLL